MKKGKKILRVVFLGRKPKNFEGFLHNLQDRILNSSFFGQNDDYTQVRFEFIPKNKKQLWSDITNLDTAKDNPLIIHFGKIPPRILKRIHEEENLLKKIFSLSRPLGGKKVRKIFKYKKRRRCLVIVIRLYKKIRYRDVA